MSQTTTTSASKPRESKPNVPTIDMFTMVVLRRRMEATMREMANALARSGRSGVLNTALDFSCSITDSKLQSLSTALGLPIHVGAIHLTSQAVVDKFGDDIHPGDCFANNSGYLGNTHCGDLTLCTPVFFDGKLVFYSIARAHFGDMGFPTPTTYNPLAKDYYEEGLTLPCVRIQRDFKDIPEVIDICKANIRAPEQFYGDYLAVLAAVRTGERRLQEICGKYGVDVMTAFLDQYQRYAEEMAAAAIRKLPKGRVEKEAFHDSDLPEYPNGIPVRAVLEVDPDEGYITIDLTNNVDNLPLGINLTECTARACCVTATLNILGPDVPRCSGAFRRIRILLREGAAVGKPRFPAATSAATTNLAQILTPHIQSMFGELRADLGTAYGSIGHPASSPCVSGSDSRHEGRSFFNQILMGYWGGAALHGHDAWVTYGSGGTQGMLWQSSVEVVELQQPVLVEQLEIIADSGGAGTWEGGPGALCAFRARNDAVRFAVTGGGRQFPPQGALGGGPGGGNWAWKIGRNGDRELLPAIADVVIEPGERLLSHGCGGGGYGEPLDRDPLSVCKGLREGRISAERARDVYGVVVDTSKEVFTYDEQATAVLRSQLRRTRTDKTRTTVAAKPN